jgi:hypothetical protein
MNLKLLFGSIIVIALGIIFLLPIIKSDIKSVELVKTVKNKIEYKKEKPKEKIPSYKNVFKELKEVSVFQLVQEERELKEIEKDTNKIIIEADAFIKKNNLNISEYNLSKEEREKINIKLDKLKKEIDNISIE